VLEAAINHAIFGVDPLIMVKSPPGAGKTFLVECACAVATAAPAMKAVVVTPQVDQAYDVVDRLLAYRLPRLEMAHAKHRNLTGLLAGRITASSGWSPALNNGPGVVVTNADLPAYYLDQLRPRSFDLMIVDEAYQLAASSFLPIADLASRLLMVGDPGQLDPVSGADTCNLEVGPHKLHWSAPAYVLDRFPSTPVYPLPVTRRLLPSTSDLVQAAFYPGLSFQSVVDPDDRRLRFGVAGIQSGIDTALDAIAAGTSLVAVTVPGAAPSHEEADTEVAAVMARLPDRILVRQAAWVGHRILTEADIGCIDPLVIAGGAVRERLRQLGRNQVRVETVERWQGLQLPISIVRHPLSSAWRPAGFGLEAGRWCVALSRHQVGCIVVARASVTDDTRGLRFRLHWPLLIGIRRTVDIVFPRMSFSHPSTNRRM
jgi:hypothetical protein